VKFYSRFVLTASRSCDEAHNNGMQLTALCAAADAEDVRLIR